MQAQALNRRPTIKDQLQEKYAKSWNDKKPSQRKKLLQEAGYPASNHYSYRAWEFIPSQMRIDVMAVIDHQVRQVLANKTLTKTTEKAEPWYQQGQYE
jgi:hypothetical protein